MGIWFLVVAVLASDVDLSENVGGQGQSGQAVKLFQAPRQISLTFHFWHKSFILDDVKLAELSNNSFWMKESDIVGGIKTYADPSYIFSGGKTHNSPRI